MKTKGQKSNKKTVLVTGGAGFIGSHLVDRLIEKGYKVVVVDNLSTGKKENLNPKAKFYKIDIQDKKIKDIFKREKPMVVFHFAAQINVRKSVEDPILDAKVNILGSLNILQNFVNGNSNSGFQKLKKFVFASTGGAIYGDAKVIPTSEGYQENPISPYGIAKLAVEKYLYYYWKVYKLKFISLRLANVYGPRQNSKGEAGVIAIFCDKMLSGNQPIINGSGKQTRDFIYVSDVVEAAISSLKKNKIGIYNIGTAKETNINKIFKELKKITNSNCKEKHGPPLEGEQERSCLDFSKAKKELGWQPKFTLEKGLKETVNWFLNKKTKK